MCPNWARSGGNARLRLVAAVLLDADFTTVLVALMQPHMLPPLRIVWLVVAIRPAASHLAVSVAIPSASD
jgi:hypothetical protein